MARARLLKPGFFTNEDLLALPFETRLLFAGLWTVADREGRLEDRPMRLKIQLFPVDDVDVDRMLSDLAWAGFIHRYEADGMPLIHVCRFTTHQHINIKEPPSTLPACDCDGARAVLIPNRHRTGTVRVLNRHQTDTAEAEAEAEADTEADTEAEAEEATAASETEYPLRECMDLWTAATGTTVTRMLGDAMESALEDTPPDWVKDAIRETGLAGAKSWKYTAAILDRWKHEGREAVTPEAVSALSKMVNSAMAWKTAHMEEHGCGHGCANASYAAYLHPPMEANG